MVAFSVHLNHKRYLYNFEISFTVLTASLLLYRLATAMRDPYCATACPCQTRSACDRVCLSAAVCVSINNFVTVLMN